MRNCQLIFVVIPFILAGCGGGGAGQSSPTAPPGHAVTPPPAGGNQQHLEGVWQGTITSNVSADTVDVIGLINGWGEMILLMDKGHLVGFPTANGTAFTADLIGITAAGFTWPDNSTSGEFSLGGTYSPDKSISGNYSGAGDNGTISLTYDPISRRGSHIDTAAGMWVQRDTSQNITAVFTVDSTGRYSGNINGTDVDGCMYSGELDTWTSTENVYDVPSMTVANCPVVSGTDQNGEYGGSGVIRDIVADSRKNDEFVIGVFSEAYAVTLVLEKL